jgi:hypothetical protein
MSRHKLTEEELDRIGREIDATLEPKKVAAILGDLASLEKTQELHDDLAVKAGVYVFMDGMADQDVTGVSWRELFCIVNFGTYQQKLANSNVVAVAAIRAVLESGHLTCGDPDCQVCRPKKNEGTEH